MAMSRRFYRNLAERYKAIQPQEDHPSFHMWGTMVLETAEQIKAENPSFRTDIFLMAAGVTWDRDASGAQG